MKELLKIKTLTLIVLSIGCGTSEIDSFEKWEIESTDSDVTPAEPKKQKEVVCIELLDSDGAKIETIDFGKQPRDVNATRTFSLYNCGNVDLQINPLDFGNAGDFEFQDAQGVPLSNRGNTLMALKINTQLSLMVTATPAGKSTTLKEMISINPQVRRRNSHERTRINVSLINTGCLPSTIKVVSIGVPNQALCAGENELLDLDIQGIPTEQGYNTVRWTIVNRPEQSAIMFTEETAARTSTPLKRPGQYTLQAEVLSANKRCIMKDLLIVDVKDCAP